MLNIYVHMIPLTDTYQWNAAHYAAQPGDIGCLKTLISHGIDPLSRTSTQLTVLDVATINDHLDVVEFLRKL